MIIQPVITTERVALITFLLCEGRHFRTVEIANLLGLTRQGAYAQLSRMARVLPISLANDEWFMVRNSDEE